MDGDDGTARESIYYPELFPITLTHGEFPTCEAVHDAMSMTYGMLVTPFIATREGSSLLQYNPQLQSHRSSGVARCDSCGGYINPFCDTTSLRWVCSLCDGRNSFARSMLRYRQVDLRLLPEMQHLLLDYPLPLQSAEDGAGNVASTATNKKKLTKAEKRKEKASSKFHCPASERPLVHVFLVQESMPLDCIQAAIDAISQATSADPETGLHPDIEIILLTFSNRIGIYRLHHDNTTVSSNNESDGSGILDSTASTYLLPACIQYSHFSIDKVCNSRTSAARLHSENNASNMSEGGVFDGQTSSEFLSLASSGPPSMTSNRKDSASSNQICPLLSLNEIASFDDVRVPIGQVRNSLRTSLSALFDASPSVSPSSGARGLDTYGQQDQGHINENENLHGPLIMLGPVLEEVVSWIIDIDSTLASTKDPTAHPSSSPSSSGSLGGLMGLFAGLGLVSTPDSANNSNDDDWIIGDNLAELTKKRTSSPIDRCTGVQLHVILSSPQDLVPGAHPSVSSSPSYASVPPGLDSDWVKTLGKRCAKHGLGVHVWGVAAFEESYGGLQDLLPLAQCTGGQLHRIILGTDPATERLRFALNLSRCLSSQSASKCLLKLRSSKLVDTSLGGSGHLMPDDELPGIYRIAHCHSASSIGFTLKYNPTPADANDEVSAYHRSQSYSNPTTIVMQVAMSYSTLAEQNADSDEEEEQEQEERRRTRLRRKTQLKNAKSKRLANNQASNSSDNDEDDNEDSDDADDEDTSNSNDSSDDDTHGCNATTTSLSTHGDNTEHAYNTQVFKNFDLHEEHQQVTKAKKSFDNEQMLKLGSRASQSKFRRDQHGRGPMHFNHARKLIAVRRLRVITLMVECTPKVPRLIKSAHSSMMAILIVRRAFMLVQSNQLSEGIEYLYNWSIEMTRSLCGIIWAHKRNQHKNAVINNEPEDWNGGGKSYTGVEYPPTPPEDRVDYVVTEALSYAKLWRFLQVIYGAVHVLFIQKRYLQYMSSNKSSSVSSDGQPSSSIAAAALVTPTWGDSFAEISSLIMTCDYHLAERILYPELVAITTNTMCVARKRLALRREALTTTGQASYLVDSGRELVLYRTVMKPSSHKINAGLGTKQSPSSSDGQASLSLPLPPSVVTTAPPSETAPSGGVVSAAVTAATSLLYPPPPIPAPSRPSSSSSTHDHDNLRGIPSEKEVGSKEEEDAKSLTIINPKWLVNDIRRRLYITPNAPRVHVAEAGKLSSIFFTEKLLEDMSNIEGGYSKFIEDLKERVRKKLLFGTP